MNELEPVAYDGQGAPLYSWSLGDRLDDETRRLLRERIDNQQA